MPKGNFSDALNGLYSEVLDAQNAYTQLRQMGLELYHFQGLNIYLGSLPLKSRKVGNLGNLVF